ncbi:unnamed protein product, partial [Polarella glacialis]
SPRTFSSPERREPSPSSPSSSGKVLTLARKLEVKAKAPPKVPPVPLVALGSSSPRRSPPEKFSLATPPLSDTERYEHPDPPFAPRGERGAPQDPHMLSRAPRQPDEQLREKLAEARSSLEARQQADSLSCTTGATRVPRLPLLAVPLRPSFDAKWSSNVTLSTSRSEGSAMLRSQTSPPTKNKNNNSNNNNNKNNNNNINSPSLHSRASPRASSCDSWTSSSCSMTASASASAASLSARSLSARSAHGEE